MKKPYKPRRAVTTAVLAALFSVILCTAQIFASTSMWNFQHEEFPDDFDYRQTTVAVRAADEDIAADGFTAYDESADGFAAYDFTEYDESADGFAAYDFTEYDEADDSFAAYDFTEYDEADDSFAAYDFAEDSGLVGAAGSETMTVTTEIEWNDDDDIDGLRQNGDGIVYLAGYINRNVQIWKTELSYDISVRGENEIVTFTDVPVYWDGQTVEYWTGMETPDGYEKLIYGDVDEGFLIKLNHTPETTSASCTVRWDDEEDRDGIRGDVTLKLIRTADGVSETQETTTVSPSSGSDEQDVSWTALPKYMNGREAEYSVEAETVDGYDVEVTGAGTNAFVVVCSHEHVAVPISVKIWWQDSGDADGLRPDSVTVALLADDSETGDSITLCASDNWQGEFDEPEDGSAEYAILENVPGGYYAVVKGTREGGFAVVNVR